jgi:PleD family two-component response regulator
LLRDIKCFCNPLIPASELAFRRWKVMPSHEEYANSKEPLNILLVDDQPAKLLSYEVILRDLGENLIRAISGREALEKY